MIQELPLIFIPNSGEVGGFTFTQIKRGEKAFIYKVDAGDTIHYEVFERKLAKLCVDFGKKIFSETDFKEIYPKSNAFGDWAWCISCYDKAIDRFSKLESR